MGFPLVPKLVTLNDLERRNGRYFALLHRNHDIWGHYYVALVEVDPYCLRQKCSPENLVFGQYMTYGDNSLRLLRKVR